jgi:hypothetical protein
LQQKNVKFYSLEKYLMRIIEMSRKKVTKKPKLKKATNKIKRTKKAVTQSSGRNTERNLKDLSIQLVSQCRNNLLGLKQQEKKLQSELKHAQSQKKTIQKQQSVLLAKTKNKPTATAKKQLASYKLALGKVNKTITALTAQHGQVKQQTKTLTQEKSKHTAIQKLLKTFEKEWATKDKAHKAVKVVKTKATPKKRNKSQKKTALTTIPATQTDTTPYDDQITIIEPEVETVA